MLQKSKFRERIEKAFSTRENSKAHKRALEFLRAPTADARKLQEVIRGTYLLCVLLILVCVTDAFREDWLSLLHNAKLTLDKCVNLTGVCDVSKKLQPSQVFIRVTLNGSV